MNPISNSNWNPKNKKVVFSNLDGVAGKYPGYLVVSTSNNQGDIELSNMSELAAVNLVKPDVVYSDTRDLEEFCGKIGTQFVLSSDDGQTMFDFSDAKEENNKDNGQDDLVSLAVEILDETTENITDEE